MTGAFVQQIEILRSRYGDEYEEVSNNILELFDTMGLDSVKTSRKYIYDYLKQMDYFIKNNDYGHKDFDSIREEIYDNDETMMTTYMPGLLLSYAYTTILGAKNHLFLTEFLPMLQQATCGVEIGFGEGFYLWEVLKKYPQMKMFGYDISPSAIKFASRVLDVAGVSREQYELQYGNIFEGIAQDTETVDFGILAEVIEHIPNPEIGIREIVRMIKVGGYLYLTTVIDSNHMDHISNFESPKVVEQMLEQENLEIIAKNIYHMTDDFPESKDISIGLAYVAKKIR